MITFIRPVFKFTSFETLYTVALTILFLFSVLITKGDDVLLINGNHSQFLDLFFKIITNFGDGIIFVIIIIVTLFIRFQYTVAAIMICIGHGLLISICKRFLFADAPRPRNFLDPDLIHFVSGVTVHGHNSFPSGHTATAFCAAFFIWLISRNVFAGIASLVGALLVGYSRIYLAQHFLIDVAAGATIGVFTTYIIWQIMEINQKPMWMNRKVNSRIKFKKRRATVNLPA